MFESIFGLTCKECGASYYEKDGYNKKFCSVECKWDWEERKEEKRQRKIDRRREQEEAREKSKVQSELEAFEDSSKRQIGSKYNVDISFNGKNVTISDTNNGQIAHLKSHISELETENEEIEKLIKDLQSEKDAL